MNTVIKTIILSLGFLLVLAMYVHSNIISQKRKEMDEKKVDDPDLWETIEIRVPKRALNKMLDDAEKEYKNDKRISNK